MLYRRNMAGVFQPLFGDVVAAERGGVFHHPHGLGIPAPRAGRERAPKVVDVDP
jgi:hypothetical protein